MLQGGRDSGDAIYTSRNVSSGYLLLGTVVSGNDYCKGYASGMGTSMQCSRARNILKGLVCQYY